MKLPSFEEDTLECLEQQSEGIWNSPFALEKFMGQAQMPVFNSTRSH